MMIIARMTSKSTPTHPKKMMSNAIRISIPHIVEKFWFVARRNSNPGDLRPDHPRHAPHNILFQQLKTAKVDQGVSIQD